MKIPELWPTFQKVKAKQYIQAFAMIMQNEFNI